MRQATARSFDLSPRGLVALKKGGVSDAVILAMQSGGSVAPDKSSTLSSPPAAPAVASPPAATKAAGSNPAAPSVPAAVLSDDGLYYVAGSTVQRIEAKTPYQTRTGSTAVSKLTFGIKPARLNAMLPGLAADLQVSQSPTFYLHVAQGESPGEYYLIRFTVKQEFGRRELEVGSAGFMKVQAGFAEKDIFLIEAKRLEKDIFLVTPKTALPAGEYSVLQIPQMTGSGQTGLTPRKIFDFGVR